MRKTVSVFIDAYLHFAAQDGWAIASHIALATLTSLFPFLIFIGALAGFAGSQSLADEASTLIFSAWPPAVADPIVAEVHQVLTTPRSGLLTIGAILSLYFSSGALEAARVGLSRAYGAIETRPWWRLRLESLAFVIAAAVSLLTLAFFVVLAPLAWLATIRIAPGLSDSTNLFTAFRLALASILMGASFAIAHLWLPNGRRRLSQIAPGVILTLLCSLAFGEGFGFYLSEYARNYVATYAGLASVMVALVFLYSLAAIFVYGGELNAAILRARPDAAKESQPAKAISYTEGYLSSAGGAPGPAQELLPAANVKSLSRGRATRQTL